MPSPGAPYGAPYPYPYPTPYYPPYPQPAYQYPFALPPPTRVWATKIGLARVITAVSIAFGVYALEILNKIFEGTTGVTDAPGSHAMATLGFNALAFLILAGKLLFLGAAVFAGASGVVKLREGRGELDLSGGDASRRGLLFLGAAAGLPFATLILSSIYLAVIQATLPGSGMVSDLGLERLWGHYRTVVLVNALVGLAAAFLFVKGLDTVLPRAAPAVPRAPFRTFATLFVTAAAANAALVLITFFALLNPPMVGAQASPAYANALLAVGPALAVAALWHLRAYLQATLRDVERRSREKALLPEPRGSPAP